MGNLGTWARGLVRGVTFVIAIGLVNGTLTTLAQGQEILTGLSADTAKVLATFPTLSQERPLGWTEAPGGYGTSWGTPSFGSVREYSEFTSPYGQGYGYGYPPSSVLPGRHGAGIWSPGSTAAWVFDPTTASRFSYRTYQVPYVKGSRNPVPPFGVYAPAFGPGVSGD